MYRSCRRLKNVSWSVCKVRNFAKVSSEAQHGQDKFKMESSPPDHTDRDWVGPPDPDSNIRAYKLYTPKNETTLEEQFRKMRQETLEWNDKYWAKHNMNFFREKDLFIKKEIERINQNRAVGSPPRRKLNAEELSVFYKQFLNENYQMHLQYNKEWYKRNISMLWPAFKLALIGLGKKR